MIFIVCLWNNLYLISRSLIVFFVLRSFFYIWVIEACMLLAVFTRSDFLFDCEMISMLYPHHWLIFSFWLDLNNVSFHLNYCSQYVSGCFTSKFVLLYVCDLFIIIYHVHIYAVSFHLIIVASLFISDLQKVIVIFDFEMINILKPVH